SAPRVPSPTTDWNCRLPPDEQPWRRPTENPWEREKTVQDLTREGPLRSCSAFHGLHSTIGPDLARLMQFRRRHVLPVRDQSPGFLSGQPGKISHKGLA